MALEITVDSLFEEEKGEMAQTRLRCQHYFLPAVFWLRGFIVIAENA